VEGKECGWAQWSKNWLHGRATAAVLDGLGRRGRRRSQRFSLRLGGSAGGLGRDVGGTPTLLEGSVLTLFWREEAEDAGMVEEPESGAEFLDVSGVRDSSNQVAEWSGAIGCPQKFQHIG
jgi:hypothetical protein